MALAAFPASGSTSWYPWATSVDTSMRVTTPRGSKTKYVAANSEPNSVKDLCDYVCTGTNDHAVFQTAVNAVGAEILKRDGTVGGKVVAVGRLFNMAGPVQMLSQVKVESEYGAKATILARSGTWAPGLTGGFFELATNKVQYTHVEGFTLDGKNASLCGFYYINGTAQEWDAFHIIRDMYIFDCGQDGISMNQDTGETAPRNRGAMISQVRIINPGRYGVYSNNPDSFYEMVDVGSSGSHGIYAGSANNRFVNCKAWYSQGNGFHVAGARDNQFAGCESQDNTGHGFYAGSVKSAFTSCLADSNGRTTGTGDGFNVAGNGTIIQGCVSSEKSEGGPGEQRWGYNISASAKVFVNGTAFGNVSGPVTGTGAAGSVVNVVGY